MNSNENASPVVSFKESPKLSGQVAQLGGMAFLVFVAAVYGVLVRNQWNAFGVLLPILVFGSALQWVAKWFDSRSTEYKLYPDRLCIGDFDLNLDEIAVVDWPMKRKGEELLLGFFLHSQSDEGLSESTEQSDDFLISIPLNELEREDKLLVVEYFQQQEVEHRNWKEFCCRFLDRWLANGSKSYFPQRLATHLKKYPFWAGFVYSPWIYLICLRAVSKYIYWALGSAIAISTVINIRLMHGSWLSPIGETLLGGAAVLFVLGAISAWCPIRIDKEHGTPSQQRASLLAAALLIAAIILGPLVVQLLMFNGNKKLALLVMQALPWIPTVPMFVQLFREQKERCENTDKFFPVAIRRWEAYCAGQVD